MGIWRNSFSSAEHKLMFQKLSHPNLDSQKCRNFVYRYNYLSCNVGYKLSKKLYTLITLGWQFESLGIR
jgi:hypothetical protein